MKLVEGDHNFYIFLFDAFTCGNREFFAFLSGLVVHVIALQGNRRVFERFIVFLLLGNAVALIHIAFNILIIVFNVVDDFVLNGPFKEIQLSNGGFHTIVVIVGDGDTLPSAKRVESAF